MAFQPFYSHTEKIFDDLQILSFSKLNNYLISLFMFRYHHLQNLPHLFMDFFIVNSQIHQYSTRNSSKLHMHYHRTNYTKHSLAQLCLYSSPYSNFSPYYVLYSY
jgi:hypothetical protein